MERTAMLHLVFVLLAFWSFSVVKASDPIKEYTWTVTYGTESPLSVPQQVILINGQFPGPTLEAVTNDILMINVINKLDEPFLLTWNGIKERKNSWEDGVLGTTCPIPPNSNFTYKIQPKDQIGTYTYFPTTAMHRAAGGFGAFNVYARPVIPVPYPKPEADYSLLIGDWYTAGHKELREILDSGKDFPAPDGLLINGRSEASFSGEPGQTYMFRISNVGLSTSINFRIEGHAMEVVEIEGSHVMQNLYDSLDVHVGQSVAVLVKLDQPPREYSIIATTPFAKDVLLATATLSYANAPSGIAQNVPLPPTQQIESSIQQAKTFRWNLTANAARPNPQGSFHYGTINTTRTIMLANSAPVLDGKRLYAVNGVSYVNPDTPLKLADYFNISGVFEMNSTLAPSPLGPPHLAASVLTVNLHEFVEIVFQNSESTIQTWHLDGYDFWVVGFGAGTWTPESRTTYNLFDAHTRHTAQVFPNSWTGILVSLDNEGMWNLRSAMWPRQYLGQQLYLRVYDSVKSLANEYDIPNNALLCGKAFGHHA